jgi:hypothetical protein
MPSEHEAVAEGRYDWVWLICLTLPHFFLKLIEINIWVVPDPDPDPGGGIGRPE